AFQQRYDQSFQGRQNFRSNSFGSRFQNQQAAPQSFGGGGGWRGNFQQRSFQPNNSGWGGGGGGWRGHAQFQSQAQSAPQQNFRGGGGGGWRGGSSQMSNGGGGWHGGGGGGWGHHR